jgi:DNA-binding NarL/FixJ family response regulator
MKTTVLIADDHGVVVDGLRFLIDSQADMSVIGSAANGQDAVRVTIDMEPDVVLMDNAMPLLNGTEATRAIRERKSATRVIMLSMYDDPVHVYRALQAGVNGYVVKKSAGKDVVEAIRAVRAGRRYVSQPLLEAVVEQFIEKGASEDPLEWLSTRERQVLQLLAEGHSVTEIAATASLSPKTVETYRSRLMTKLGIRDLPGLVKFAIQHGLTSVT